MATAPVFIVVSGLPGGGKSTVGAALAAARRLPLLDKDLILEQMFDTLGVGDAAHRSRLRPDFDSSK